MIKDIEKTFISRKQLMKKLRISEATLWKLMYSRKMPFYKFDRKVFFNVKEIDEYIENFKNN